MQRTVKKPIIVPGQDNTDRHYRRQRPAIDPPANELRRDGTKYHPAIIDG
ncbi:MAG: hypothetical protein JXM68_13050 [Sedimentisphaerales bacterium]|nr:hypothetical protein [Sedimentisphaerales bacterium]